MPNHNFLFLPGHFKSEFRLYWVKDKTLKKIIIGLIFGLLGALSACNSVENEFRSSLEGQFAGTFERTDKGISLGVAEVTLAFEGDRFGGSGGANRYPSICQGTFALSRNTITFNNTCFFTAEFDWSLILSGTYQIRREGEEIVFRRSMGDLIDTYRLRRVEVLRQ
ncbi:hypothetical protein CLV48_11763 [Cecembia rubra]|uniref:META domain-containing protein n=1 Tax=Cecembia rubra TaxID=1485585 RepID=A0A2P8DPX3_9BACT|nr:hypothetical protein CLV48_11763 [Cecembia rubra]